VRFLDVFRSRRVLVIALLGFSSGLPYLLTAQTFSAWLTAEGVSLEAIGAAASVGLVYNLKWAWAPLLDRFRWPFLGRRRGWLLVLQLALAAAIALMGSLSPHDQPEALALAAVVVAVLSASQDVVVDAFNADTLHPEERAAGGGMYVTGYRTAMLIAGTLALVLADHVEWRAIYGGLAALMGLGVVGTLLASEPAESEPAPTLADAFWRPFAMLLTQPRVLVVLGFVAFYRISEQLTLTMLIPYLSRDLGFTFTEIALEYKLLGFAGLAAGGVLGGALVARLGLARCLLAFGVLQAATNLLWAALALFDRSLVALGAAVVVDHLANAMGAGAFVAFLMARTDRAASATQMALLTALSSLIGRTIGVASGVVIAHVGWSGFWVATALASLPALALVPFLPRDRDRL
jgi:PAT family beta-lactamase induction signal transducer AmpG